MKTRADINKIKSRFFQKRKLIKHQPDSSRNKRRGPKSIKLEMKKGEIITDSTGIK